MAQFPHITFRSHKLKKPMIGGTLGFTLFLKYARTYLWDCRYKFLNFLIRNVHFQSISTHNQDAQPLVWPLF